MTSKIVDLTVEEFKSLINEAFRVIMEEVSEDITALSSDDYLKSIEEARKDYRSGKVKKFEEVFDV
ncbi:MAG: hypothetical protein KAT16_02045 [Candidatus Heimdallarchaeota archaeon]|nr:hypothetical protein [Candidatus Heimdallarchaeota archaeon]